MKKWKFDSKPALSKTPQMISGPEDNQSTFLALARGKIKQLIRCKFKIQKIIVERANLVQLKQIFSIYYFAKDTIQTNLEQPRHAQQAHFELMSANSESQTLQPRAHSGNAVI